MKLNSITLVKTSFAIHFSPSNRIKKVLIKRKNMKLQTPWTNCLFKLLEFQYKYWNKSGFQLKTDIRIARLTCSMLH